ncbi:MAG: type II toxin-antitoxin system VapC family toxin [bacterium]
MKNLVDSCGWLEYFAGGPNAGFFAKPLRNLRDLLVPSICVLEVFKQILRQRDENSALIAAAAMLQGNVVDLDAAIALNAAKIGSELNLPLADSVILATALSHDAVVWTEDSHFKGIKGVRYVEKQ